MENNISIDFTKLLVVPIDEVRANPWNPKDKDTKEFNDVKASIEANGLMSFIVVRDNPIEGSPYEIIDGEQRWRACKELGFDKVAIYNEGKVDEKKAKELTIWWQTQVDFNELSLAKLVSGMIEEFGSINSPYTEKTIAEMQELAKFSFENYTKTSTKPPEMPDSEMLKTFMVQVTTTQYDIISQALDKARKAVGEDTEITDSKALELVCAEYINTPDGQ